MLCEDGQHHQRMDIGERTHRRVPDLPSVHKPTWSLTRFGLCHHHPTLMQCAQKSFQGLKRGPLTRAEGGEKWSDQCCRFRSNHSGIMMTRLALGTVENENRAQRQRGSRGG